MEGKSAKLPSLQATHSHLSFCLRSTSSLLGSAAAAAQAAEDDMKESGEGFGSEGAEISDLQSDAPGHKVTKGAVSVSEDANVIGRDAAPLSLVTPLESGDQGSGIQVEVSPELTMGGESRPELDLSGRFTTDDKEIDRMDRRELVSSAASGSDRSTYTGHSETGSEGCSEDMLDLVEGAIFRMLSRGSRVRLQDNVSRRPVENPKGVSESTLEEGIVANKEEQDRSQHARQAKSANSERNMQLLASLLDQVHDMRRYRNQGFREAEEPLSRRGHGNVISIKGGGTHNRPRRENKSSTDRHIKMTLEAAAEAANAAADAAQAAAVSVARNTEAIEMLLRTLKGQGQRRRKSKSTETHSSASDNEDVSQKAIVKQNRRTHWILGFMVVTTIAWRFGVVKVGNRLRNKLSNPLDYVGGLLGSGNGTAAEESDDEPHKGNLLEQLQQIELPSLLPSDSVDKKDPIQKTDLPKSTDSEPIKQEGKTVFNFGNLLQIKPDKK